MLMPTITYIPTILAYIFVLLLIFILGFIVLYISHKIYGYIYDNIPLMHLTTEELSRNQSDIMHQYSETSMKPKAKQALKIYVHMEPSHLAYCIMDHSIMDESGIQERDRHSSKLIKYFDSLSAIPHRENM